MHHSTEPQQEVNALRRRLTQLSEASLRINESLDFDEVLQSAVDNARELTNARYAAMTILGDEEQDPHFIVSGMTEAEHRGLWEMPEGRRFFDFLSGLDTPLRVADVASQFAMLGMPEFLPSVAVPSLLVAPMRHGGAISGTIYLSKGEQGQEFSQEDEETLVMFASQAALVIANARQHRDDQRARADLEALIDTSPVGVAVLNARTGELVSYNREAERIVGSLHDPARPLAELLEIASFRRADGSEFSLRELPLADVLTTGHRVRTEEIVIRVPDGRSVATLINATPILSHEGETVSFVVTIQDMTQVEEQERLRAEFLAMVSHELRAPLTSVKGSVSNLLDPAATLDPAEVTQFLRIIDSQCNRMRDMIGDLLDVARIETGELSVSPVPVELAILIDEAKNIYISGGGRSNILADIPVSLPVVMADQRRIAQVINNLLSNASRHSSETTPIKITSGLNETHVWVSVIDHGRGIPAESLPHLFRKFSRFEAEDQGGDTGLGLAICKGIVEAHGGRIWAESDGPGLGARFTFTLPVADSALSADPAGRGRPAAGDAVPGNAEGRPRILLVDDDPQMQRYIRDVLSKAGFTTVSTGNPTEIAQLLEQEEPHLVLMDLMLPQTDGIELMQTIPGLSEVPVIFLSAYGQDQIIAKAFDMGAADYVVKPFSSTELTARIQATLRRQDAIPTFSAIRKPFVMGDLVVDYTRKRAFLSDQQVDLTAFEYRVLAELSANLGRIMTHEQLVQRVWGHEYSGNSGPVRAIVKRLRRKLGDEAGKPKYIYTKRRVGYWMERDE